MFDVSTPNRSFAPITPFSVSMSGWRIRCDPSVVVCAVSRYVTNTRLWGSAASSIISRVLLGSRRDSTVTAGSTRTNSTSSICCGLLSSCSSKSAAVRPSTIRPSRCGYVSTVTRMEPARKVGRWVWPGPSAMSARAAMQAIFVTPDYFLMIASSCATSASYSFFSTA